MKGIQQYTGMNGSQWYTSIYGIQQYTGMNGIQWYSSMDDIPMKTLTEAQNVM